MPEALLSAQYSCCLFCNAGSGGFLIFTALDGTLMLVLLLCLVCTCSCAAEDSVGWLSRLFFCMCIF